MKKNIDLFLKLSNLKHEASLDLNYKEQNKIAKKMDTLEKEIPNEGFLDMLNLASIKDWNRLDIGAKLAIKRKDKIGIGIIRSLTSSEDEWTQIDAKTYLEDIIPYLEKEGKL